jgi:hypothetical protein
MTFSAEFRCYIGSQTLAAWPTALAGLLPPWPTVLGPNVVAHGARPLTPWGTTLCLSHAKGPLLVAPSVVAHDLYFDAPFFHTQQTRLPLVAFNVVDEMNAMPLWECNLYLNESAICWALADMQCNVEVLAPDSQLLVLHAWLGLKG